MEQPVASSSLSFTDTPISINEIIPIQDTMIPSSLPSTVIKRSQAMNHRVSFPLESYLAEQQPHTSQNNADQLHGNHLDSKTCIVPSVFSQVKTKYTPSNRASIADIRLQEIIQNLDETSVDEEKTAVTGCSKWIRQSRRFLRHMMEQSKFHYTIVTLIILDLIVVFIELILAHLSVACLTDEEMKHEYNTTKQRKECFLPHTHQLETGELALYYISLTLISIFVLEILIGSYAFGWRRYKKILYLFDAVVVLVSFILEVYFHFGSASKAGQATGSIIVLRLWKIIRVSHAVGHSISVRNHMIIIEIEKARTVLKEENLQAEKTIREQEIKINNLMNLLGKTDTQSTAKQINEFTRSRTPSFNYVTCF